MPFHDLEVPGSNPTLIVLFMRSNFDLLFDFFSKKNVFQKKCLVSKINNLILSIFGAFQAKVDRPYLPIYAPFYCDVVAFLDLFL